ncbi:hypothetical protein D9623_33810 (plasmid) [Azospirillum brasilense]|uniref:Uncharacterized protein n=1 Tax=Azospirillum brasilense TaxID=192 RepID=A0A4D8QUU3_AZOBR|nr:hypothetical protein D3868_28135 [Azospirillum brasilense]QEM01393.1 hypothetical protein D9623_33810 [Azospirillum brasilense]TVZ67439.1 hypothetical protein OH82_00579 [Azospirillum brasilense]TWB84841.1 hypothetical protein FBZ81_103107 [Azospirillum brasilense]
MRADRMPSGLERAEWFRGQARYHLVGGKWWARLTATAAAIELRLESGDEPVMSFKSPLDLLVDAAAMRLAAAVEDAPQVRAEMLAGAAALEARAFRGGHVTEPR